MIRYESDGESYYGSDEEDAKNGVHTLHYKYENDMNDIVYGVKKWLHNANEEEFLDFEDKSAELLKKIKNSEIKEFTTSDGRKHFSQNGWIDLRGKRRINNHYYPPNVKELLLIMDSIIGHFYKDPNQDRLLDLDYYFTNHETTFFYIRYEPFADKTTLFHNILDLHKE